MKKIIFLVISLLLFGCSTTFNAQENISPDHPDFAWVTIISRPIAKKNEIIPSTTKGFRHMAIVSDLLPYGIWEMGPDGNGNIATTHTVKNLSEWHTHKVTQKCIELGGDYIKSQSVGISKKGLLDCIKLYEKDIVGLKYSRYSYNENYTVESVIFGAGGSIKK